MMRRLWMTLCIYWGSRPHVSIGEVEALARSWKRAPHYLRRGHS